MSTSTRSASANRRASPVDKAVGRQLRLARERAGLSQHQLAELCGVTVQQMSKYELGRDRLAVARLHEISVVLGIPVASFFEGLAEQDRGSDLQRLIGSFVRIPDQEGREKILELAERAARHATGNGDRP